ncbi:hypothetical protein FRACYDRAFT_256137 [Fragilariopsis cylindrus CCMP1102]|uniref:Uncharacterized protein n=1 Tax=Fragilariopsis cylindrus CCMP1102 TaxID=635003 RepID=A0A1E7EJU2_9STRA|nr:hypothetical protein FRACYDRAFT_256137 [Fragilariopsis cylindrus CCMP1102]|eukprot:OEU06137.1 hypothetical protein FRACYDRAFT_256137 [Fragilariopsis cylindrus CCMP1102]
MSTSTSATRNPIISSSEIEEGIETRAIKSVLRPSSISMIIQNKNPMITPQQCHRGVIRRTTTTTNRLRRNIGRQKIIETANNKPTSSSSSLQQQQQQQHRVKSSRLSHTYARTYWR